ncbi:MAG: GatB/YqeY domain-containing protein [Pseudomonadales bacterium]
MSELQKTISEATKVAMKARDKERVAVLRMVNAEFKRVEVDERRELSDADILSILTKMQKQRQDSLSQFESAGREDLAAQERYELEVLQTFMPEPMGAAEITAAVAAAIASTGASGMSDMGKVMGALKSTLSGRADMGAVSAQVKSQLNP